METGDRLIQVKHLYRVNQGTGLMLNNAKFADLFWGFCIGINKWK